MSAIRDRVVAITGASSGTGEATFLCSPHGAKVVLGTLVSLRREAGDRFAMPPAAAARTLPSPPGSRTTST